MVDLLTQVIDHQHHSDAVLSHYFRSHHLNGSYQRTKIAEDFYTILRNYYKLSTVENNNIAVVVKNFYASNKLIPLVNLNDLVSTCELPQWIIDKLSLNYSIAKIITLAQAMQTRAPLDLRVNILKTTVTEIQTKLIDQGLTVEQTLYSPYGLRINHHNLILATNPLFKAGLIEVQDQSSQLACILLGARRKEMIVDFCAGSGGKTLTIGMMMHNQGRIYAFDNNEARISKLAPRLKRSGLSNIYAARINNESDQKIKRLHHKIDRVIVDAPCTGFGTLRRNPDLKFKHNQQTLNEITAKQMTILNQAAKLVKAGGYLLYATCSILIEENQDIINQFLNNNYDFNIVNAQERMNIPQLKFIDPNFLILLPHLHHSDGFFAALMQKIK